jgi:hypothetical protein
MSAQRQRPGGNLDLGKATADVQQQTKVPPTVNVTVPPPIVQIIPVPAPAPTQKPVAPPPSSPFNIRLVPSPFEVLAKRLGEAHVRGLDLLDRASRMDAPSLEKEFREWADGILSALTETKCWATAYIMNSDVGLPLPPVSEKVPEVNRVLYHNIRFRIYRLDQLLPKLQASPNTCP